MTRKQRRRKMRNRLIRSIYIDRGFHSHADIVWVEFNSPLAFDRLKQYGDKPRLTVSFYAEPDKGEAYVSKHFPGITYRVSKMRHLGRDIRNDVPYVRQLEGGKPVEVSTPSEPLWWHKAPALVPIEDCEMPTTLTNILKAHGVHNAQQLIDSDPKERAGWKGIGFKSRQEIADVIAAFEEPAR